jgi:hypothetical protein
MLFKKKNKIFDEFSVMNPLNIKLPKGCEIYICDSKIIYNYPIKIINLKTTNNNVLSVHDYKIKHDTKKKSVGKRRNIIYVKSNVIHDEDINLY